MSELTPSQAKDEKIIDKNIADEEEAIESYASAEKQLSTEKGKARAAEIKDDEKEHKEELQELKNWTVNKSFRDMFDDRREAVYDKVNGVSHFEKKRASGNGLTPQKIIDVAVRHGNNGKVNTKNTAEDAEKQAKADKEARDAVRHKWNEQEANNNAMINNREALHQERLEIASRLAKNGFMDKVASLVDAINESEATIQALSEGSLGGKIGSIFNVLANGGGRSGVADVITKQKEKAAKEAATIEKTLANHMGLLQELNELMEPIRRYAELGEELETMEGAEESNERINNARGALHDKEQKENFENEAMRMKVHPTKDYIEEMKETYEDVKKRAEDATELYDIAKKMLNVGEDSSYAADAREAEKMAPMLDEMKAQIDDAVAKVAPKKEDYMQTPDGIIEWNSMRRAKNAHPSWMYSIFADYNLLDDILRSKGVDLRKYGRDWPELDPNRENAHPLSAIPNPNIKAKKKYDKETGEFIGWDYPAGSYTNYNAKHFGPASARNVHIRTENPVRVVKKKDAQGNDHYYAYGWFTARLNKRYGQQYKTKNGVIQFDENGRAISEAKEDGLTPTERMVLGGRGSNSQLANTDPNSYYSVDGAASRQKFSMNLWTEVSPDDVAKDKYGRMFLMEKYIGPDGKEQKRVALQDPKFYSMSNIGKDFAGVVENFPGHEQNVNRILEWMRNVRYPVLGDDGRQMVDENGNPMFRYPFQNMTPNDMSHKAQEAATLYELFDLPPIIDGEIVPLKRGTDEDILTRRTVGEGITLNKLSSNQMDFAIKEMTKKANMIAEAALSLVMRQFNIGNHDRLTRLGQEQIFDEMMRQRNSKQYSTQPGDEGAPEPELKREDWVDDSEYNGDVRISRPAYWAGDHFEPPEIQVGGRDIATSLSIQELFKMLFNKSINGEDTHNLAFEKELRKIGLDYESVQKEIDLLNDELKDMEDDAYARKIEQSGIDMDTFWHDFDRKMRDQGITPVYKNGEYRDSKTGKLLTAQVKDTVNNYTTKPIPLDERGIEFVNIVLHRNNSEKFDRTDEGYQRSALIKEYLDTAAFRQFEKLMATDFAGMSVEDVYNAHPNIRNNLLAQVYRDWRNLSIEKQEQNLAKYKADKEAMEADLTAQEEELEKRRKARWAMEDESLGLEQKTEMAKPELARRRDYIRLGRILAGNRRKGVIDYDPVTGEYAYDDEAQANREAYEAAEAGLLDWENAMRAARENTNKTQEELNNLKTKRNAFLEGTDFRDPVTGKKIANKNKITFNGYSFDQLRNFKRKGLSQYEMSRGRDWRNTTTVGAVESLFKQYLTPDNLRNLYRIYTNAIDAHPNASRKLWALREEVADIYRIVTPFWDDAKGEWKGLDGAYVPPDDPQWNYGVPNTLIGVLESYNGSGELERLEQEIEGDSPLLRRENAVLTAAFSAARAGVIEDNGLSEANFDMMDDLAQYEFDLRKAKQDQEVANTDVINQHNITEEGQKLAELKGIQLNTEASDVKPVEQRSAISTKQHGIGKQELDNRVRTENAKAREERVKLTDSEVADRVADTAGEFFGTKEEEPVVEEEKPKRTKTPTEKRKADIKRKASRATGEGKKKVDTSSRLNAGEVSNNKEAKDAVSGKTGGKNATQRKKKTETVTPVGGGKEGKDTASSSTEQQKSKEQQKQNRLEKKNETKIGAEMKTACVRSWNGGLITADEDVINTPFRKMMGGSFKKGDMIAENFGPQYRGLSPYERDTLNFLKLWKSKDPKEFKKYMGFIKDVTRRKKGMYWYSNKDGTQHPWRAFAGSPLQFYAFENSNVWEKQGLREAMELYHQLHDPEKGKFDPVTVWFKNVYAPNIPRGKARWDAWVGDKNAFDRNFWEYLTHEAEEWDGVNYETEQWMSPHKSIFHLIDYLAPDRPAPGGEPIWRLADRSDKFKRQKDDAKYKEKIKDMAGKILSKQTEPAVTNATEFGSETGANLGPTGNKLDETLQSYADKRGAQLESLPSPETTARVNNQFRPQIESTSLDDVAPIPSRKIKSF